MHRIDPLFQRYIGIDYSGAANADTGLPGIRVYTASNANTAQAITPDATGKRHWSRRGLARWIDKQLSDPRPTIIGLDHAFSFPLRYFHTHAIDLDWTAFLTDFSAHWPTDKAGISVEAIRTGKAGQGFKRHGNARWRRLTEQGSRAKSVFHFDVPGSVAKSTHAGLPWLDTLRQRWGERVHCWPFDGWSVPRGRSVIAEIYPSLWSADYPRANRTPDQHDAYVVATALQALDHRGALDGLLTPYLDTDTAAQAQIEGWILGVTPSID
ncbi:MAG: hypothetical protein RI539_05300 [Spiribacter sp.]|jgi:hypothetical protein|nr:hypothetical protein [Spiribacter sp.]MDR9489743.1 hypothetical protein [Spiribacter sp.]